MSRLALPILLLLAALIVGCSPAQTPPVAPPTAPQTAPPVATATSPEKLDQPEAVTIAVRTAIQAFLANDFSAAQKAMLFQPAELKDEKTVRLFSEFSAHLNKRLALEAKGAGQNATTPVLSVTNIRQTDNGDSLADITIGAGPDLEPLRLTVKTIKRNGTWLVDYAYFMLALIDELEE